MVSELFSEDWADVSSFLVRARNDGLNIGDDELELVEPADRVEVALESLVENPVDGRAFGGRRIGLLVRRFLFCCQ